MGHAKVYDVLVDGKSVYSGPIRTAEVVFSALMSAFAERKDPPYITIAFVPTWR